MKRILVLTIAITLLIITPAIGEIDLQSMTDDELAALNQQIQTELFNRHAAGTGVLVPVGYYVVGEDLPAGRYQVIASEDDAVVTFEVLYDLKRDFGNTYWLGSVYGGTTANITLKEGYALRVNSKAITLRLFTSLF